MTLHAVRTARLVDGIDCGIQRRSLVILFAPAFATRSSTGMIVRRLLRLAALVSTLFHGRSLALDDVMKLALGPRRVRCWLLRTASELGKRQGLPFIESIADCVRWAISLNMATAPHLHGGHFLQQKLPECILNAIARRLAPKLPRRRQCGTSRLRRRLLEGCRATDWGAELRMTPICQTRPGAQCRPLLHPSRLRRLALRLDPDRALPCQQIDRRQVLPWGFEPFLSPVEVAPSCQQ